jgi:hypothetical protein
MSFSFAWTAAAAASWRLQEQLLAIKKRKIRKEKKIERKQVPLQICIL